MIMAEESLGSIVQAQLDAFPEAPHARFYTPPMQMYLMTR